MKKILFLLVMLCLGATIQAQTNIMQVTKFIRTAKIGGSYVIQVNTNGVNNWVTVGGSGISDGIISLGTSPYGLTKPNDSTYTADSTLLATRLRVKHVNDSTAAALTTAINSKVNIGDTATMLSPYLPKADTGNKWIGAGWLPLFVKYGDTSSTIATRTWVQAQGYVSTRDRFGFSGEDVTASADRAFNLNNNKFDFDSGSVHVRRKVTSPRSDDIFSVSNGATKVFYLTQDGQTYATEFFSGAGSFYSIGGALGIINSAVNLSGSTYFQAFQKKFEINKSWPALNDSIGFEIKNDTFGISTLSATWANTYKIASFKYRSGVDNSLTERFDFRGNGDFNITGTGATKFQSGNTSQRPSSPTTGMMRYNTDSTSFEYYTGSAWLKFGTSGGGGSDGYVDNATFNTTTNYLTIEQTGAADVSVRIPPSYIRNPINADSITKALNDSVLMAKSVSVTSANTKITVNTTRNDSALIHQLTVNEANFTGIPQSAVTNLTTDLGNKLNISDTVNKWITHLYRKPGTDSVFYIKGGTHTFAFKDSISTSGGGGSGISILGNTGNLWLTRVNDSTYAVDSATLFDYGLRRNDSASAANLTGFTTDTYLRNFVKKDTTTLASLGAGAGQAGDTAAFSTSTIYGSFYNDGIDTLVITSMRGILQGTSPSVTYDVYYNDSLNVTAGATKLVTAGTALTNTATGAAVTSFDNTKIPPGVWVWVKTTTVTTKPTYFSLSLIGFKSRRI